MKPLSRTRLGGALLASAILVTALLVGCTKGAGNSTGAEDASNGPPGAAALTGVETAYVEVSGEGATRDAAIDDALSVAVAQVNGKVLGAAAKGAVKDYKILSEKEVERKIPERKDKVTFTDHQSASVSASESGSVRVSGHGEHDSGSADYSSRGSANADRETTLTNQTSGMERVWQVQIGANVNKFKAGADAGKPRLVVAQPKTSGASFEIGDSAQAAADVAGRIQHMIAESIQQSNRFLVIDRSFEKDLNQELDVATSQNANPADIVKLGQRLTADILVVPVIDHLEYHKNVRHLSLSGKDLISYSGGFSAHVSAVNVSTGQLVLNETYSTQFPATDPQIYGPGFNGQAIVDKAISELVDKFAHSLLVRTFPISVLSLDGSTAVLSQGGTLVKVGEVYDVVKMGDPMVDPQTKQQLGRIEKPFGTIRIMKVVPTMSYGELSSTMAASEFKKGLLELRDAVVPQNSAEPSVVKDNPEKVAPKPGSKRGKATDVVEDDFLK